MADRVGQEKPVDFLRLVPAKPVDSRVWKLPNNKLMLEMTAIGNLA